MEKLGRYNGNDQFYETDLPKIEIIGGSAYNDVAIAHIEKNTGMKCKKVNNNLVMQPKTAIQFATLFVTYNFKTQYHNNSSNKNTLFLKSCNDMSFRINSVCIHCLKENNVPLYGDFEADTRFSI